MNERECGYQTGREFAAMVGAEVLGAAICMTLGVLSILRWFPSDSDSPVVLLSATAIGIGSAAVGMIAGALIALRLQGRPR